MNKKAQKMLGEHLLTNIIAVICILILIGLLVYLYFSATKNKDLEIAKSSMNYLVNGINSNFPEVEIANPEGWGIYSWPMTSGSVTYFPKLCSDKGWKKCICICKIPMLLAGFSVQTGSATNTGAGGLCEEGSCLESDFSVIGEGINSNSITILNPPMTLYINYKDKTISKTAPAVSGGVH